MPLSASFHFFSPFHSKKKYHTIAFSLIHSILPYHFLLFFPHIIFIPLPLLLFLRYIRNLAHINITKLKRILRQIAISHKYFIHNDLLI